MPTYSIIIPVHNEEEVLPDLFEALNCLCRDLDETVEFVFVDDGSSDASWQILAERSVIDPRCRALRLSRNFGHQVAVTAGLDVAAGDAVVIMDADLQDPPEVVVEMAKRWREGYDVVYGQRTDREHDTPFKRVSAGLFYKMLRSLSSVDIPEQVGDFRLVDRAVVEAMKQMPERNRYVRGMFAWLGFRQIGVEYERPARRAGATSYTLKKMLRLASDGVVGYSKVPLRAPLLAGVAFVAAGTAGVATSAVVAMSTDRRLRGLTSWSATAIVGGAQLVAIGIVGEYVSRIFDEALDRPLYVVRDTRGQALESYRSEVTPIDQQRKRMSGEARVGIARRSDNGHRVHTMGGPAR